MLPSKRGISTLAAADKINEPPAEICTRVHECMCVCVAFKASSVRVKNKIMAVCKKLKTVSPKKRCSPLIISGAAPSLVS